MYLIGVIVFFILSVFYIALIHNKKLIEKYEWVEANYIMFKHCSEFECVIIFLLIILWPLTITIIFIVSIGYCLFKIFSKLIDYFVK